MVCQVGELGTGSSILLDPALIETGAGDALTIILAAVVIVFILAVLFATALSVSHPLGLAGAVGILVAGVIVVLMLFGVGNGGAAMVAAAAAVTGVACLVIGLSRQESRDLAEAERRGRGMSDKELLRKWRRARRDGNDDAGGAI